MGATAAIVFSSLGAAYGTAKSGTGIAAMSVMRPELIMKSIIPGKILFIKSQLFFLAEAECAYLIHNKYLTTGFQPIMC